MAVEKWTQDRRRQLTRTALVEAAADVFARRGFEGASLEEIAETAGFTRGAIYKNFAGKADLFLAVVEHFNERALQVFGDHLARGAGAAFDVHALATIWQETHRDAPQLMALGLEFRLYEMRNPDIRARSAAQRDRTRQMIAKFMEDNAEANGLTLKVTADTLAAIVIAASDGFSLSGWTEPEDLKLYEAFLDLLIPATIIENPKPPARRSRPRAPEPG